MMGNGRTEPTLLKPFVIYYKPSTFHVPNEAFLLGYQYHISDSNNTNITIKEVGTHLHSNLLLLFYLEAILTNQRKLQGYCCSSLTSSPSFPSL